MQLSARLEIFLFGSIKYFQFGKENETKNFDISMVKLLFLFLILEDKIFCEKTVSVQKTLGKHQQSA